MLYIYASIVGWILNIVIKKSAFKHGISGYSINACLLNVCADVLLLDDPEKRLFIGFDNNGNPLEVIGIMEAGTLTIIHAMKLRKQFHYLLEEMKK
jgi:hypothetical protein